MISSNEDIKNNILSFPGKIHLICTDKELSSVTDKMMKAKILGFDTETRPSFVKGQVYKVSLLQLSTDEDAFVIRLRNISKYDNLISIFENPEVVKVGVAIRDDIKILQKIFKFKQKNFVELQSLAKEKGMTKFGLKGMSEELLGGTVSKGPKMTNWDAKVLTDKQIMYAATDAWIGLKLFEKLG